MIKEIVMMKNAKRRESALIVLLVFLMSFQVSADTTDLLKQSVLVGNFKTNPIKFAKFQLRTGLMQRKDANGRPKYSLERISEITNSYEQLIQNQFNVSNTGGLADPNRYTENARKLLVVSAKLLGDTFGYGVAGDASAALVEMGAYALEDYATSDRVDAAHEQKAKIEMDSKLLVSKVTKSALEYYRNAPEGDKEYIRQQLREDIGVDLNATKDEICIDPYYSATCNYIYNADNAIQQSLAQLSDQMNQAGINNEEAKNKIQELFNEKLSEFAADMGLKIAELKEIAEENGFKTIATGKYLAGKIGKNTAILNKMEKDADTRAQRLKEAKAKARGEAAIFEFGSLLLNQIDPKAGQAFTVFTGSMMQVSNAVDQYNIDSKFKGNFATAALTLDVVKASMAIIGLFSNNNQPSPDQMILEQIAKLQEQISNLRVEMHNRFDIVDSKLDAIFNAVNTGFDLIQGKVDTTISAISANTQISLNTQSLILAESQRLSDLVRDFFLVPCIEWKASSTIPLSDERFTECALQLNNYAESQVLSDQIQGVDQLSGVELEAYFTTAPGRMTDALYKMFNERTMNYGGVNILPAHEEWYMASSWYRDFILDDPQQTQRALTSTNLDEIMLYGDEFISFRNNILNELEAYNNGNHENTLSNYFNKSTELVDAIRQAQADGLATYNSINGLSLTNVGEPLVNIQWNNTVWHAHESAYEITNEAVLHLAQRPELLNINKMIESGSGIYSVNIELVSFECTIYDGLNVFYSTDCNSIVIWPPPPADQDPLIPVWSRPEKDLLRVTLIYESLIANTKTEVLNAEFTHDYDNPGNYLLATSGYPHLSPNLYDVTAVSDAIKTIDNHATNIDSTAILQVENEWEQINGNVASYVVNELNNTVSMSINDAVIGENAYFARLLGFTFGEVMQGSDELFALSNGNAGIPTINEMLEIIGDQHGAVWDMAEFVEFEMQSLQSYFVGSVFSDFINQARPQLITKDVMLSFKSSDSIIQNAEEVAPIDDDSDAPSSDNESNSSGGGGGGALHPLVLFGFLILLFIRNALIRK